MKPTPLQPEQVSLDGLGVLIVDDTVAGRSSAAHTPRDLALRHAKRVDPLDWDFQALR